MSEDEINTQASKFYDMFEEEGDEASFWEEYEDYMKSYITDYTNTE